jgi:hypothetical protein
MKKTTILGLLLFFMALDTVLTLIGLKNAGIVEINPLYMGGYESSFIFIKVIIILMLSVIWLGYDENTLNKIYNTPIRNALYIVIMIVLNVFLAVVCGWNIMVLLGVV